jgi:hypothetical protein
MQHRIDITSVITEDSWPMMEQAGYADFLISQVEKELQDPVSVFLSVGRDAEYFSTFSTSRVHRHRGGARDWNLLRPLTDLFLS